MLCLECVSVCEADRRLSIESNSSATNTHPNAFTHSQTHTFTRAHTTD